MKNKEPLEAKLGIGEFICLERKTGFLEEEKTYITYSGMPSRDSFSLRIRRFNFGELDRDTFFYPINCKNLSVYGYYEFEVLEVTPEQIRFRHHKKK